MSQWTHVCGAIRINAIPTLDGITIDSIKERFGNTCEYESPSKIWEKCNVPCGSEGSVQYRVERTGDDNSLSWGIVYIWGDLRNYDNHNEIYDWIKKACDGLMIRSCSVKIDVEYKGEYLVTDYFNEEKMEIKIVIKDIK